MNTRPDAHQAQDKAILRQEVRKARRERSTKPEHAAALAEHVMDLEEVRSACEAGSPIACYSSMDHEPPTHELITRLRAAGATVLLPRINGNALQWITTDEHTHMTTNSLGIREPTGDPSTEEPSLWIIPALAVDADGYRLGQGGGYYDRALANLPNDGRGPIIALIFEEEAVPEVPREPHDHQVDIVVTPERVRWLAMPD